MNNDDEDYDNDENDENVLDTILIKTTIYHDDGGSELRDHLNNNIDIIYHGKRGDSVN